MIKLFIFIFYSIYWHKSIDNSNGDFNNNQSSRISVMMNLSKISQKNENERIVELRNDLDELTWMLNENVNNKRKKLNENNEENTLLMVINYSINSIHTIKFNHDPKFYKIIFFFSSS